MKSSWISLSNNISDPRLKAKIEAAIRTGIGERQNPKVRVNQTSDVFVIWVTVAGNTWKSNELPLNNRTFGALEFEVIQPLQRWAKAGFPD